MQLTLENLAIIDQEDMEPGHQMLARDWLVPEDSANVDRADITPTSQSTSADDLHTELSESGESRHNHVTVQQTTRPQPASEASVPPNIDLASTVNSALEPPKPDANYASWLGKSRKLDTSADEKREFRYSCSFKGCLATFQTRKGLKYHKKDKHDYCSICDIDFPNWDAYHEHKVDSKEHITCPLCSADFSSLEGRRLHSKTVSELHRRYPNSSS